MNNTISGFNIEKRDLTEEEATRDITVPRFLDFHYASGEDFLDSTGEGNFLIFTGWLLHEYPRHNQEILEVANSGRKEIQAYKELDFLGFDTLLDIEVLYYSFARFCNVTGALKYRVNQILIQMAEWKEGKCL
jgi:hypothetical protein